MSHPLTRELCSERRFPDNSSVQSVWHLWKEPRAVVIVVIAYVVLETLGTSWSAIWREIFLMVFFDRFSLAPGSSIITQFGKCTFKYPQERMFSCDFFTESGIWELTTRKWFLRECIVQWNFSNTFLGFFFFIWGRCCLFFKEKIHSYFRMWKVILFHDLKMPEDSYPVCISVKQ